MARRSRRRWWPIAATPRAAAAIALSLALLVAACDDGGDAATPRERASTTTLTTEALRPTLAGGLTLPSVDPAALLVGDGIVFGEALPSENDGLAELTGEPEVAAGLVRRVYAPDGSHLGAVVALGLRPEAFFDQAVLDGWRRGLVAALAGAPRARDVEVAGDAAVSAAGRAGSVVAITEGSAVAVLLADDDVGATALAAAVRQAHRRGEPGRPDPTTPMRPVVAGAVFLPVPAVSFLPFPFLEDPGPAPAVGGFGPAEVRIVAMGGERRAVAWAFGTDPAARPTGEAVQAGLAEAVGARTGAEVRTVELADRAAVTADGKGGAVLGFRHGSVAVIVEGRDRLYVEAAVSAWIRSLGPP